MGIEDIKKYKNKKTLTGLLAGGTALAALATYMLFLEKNQDNKYPKDYAVVSVDKANPKASIESLFTLNKEDFDLNHIDIQSEVDGSHSIVCRDGEMEDDTFRTDAMAKCTISAEVFDEIGHLFSENTGSIIQKELCYHNKLTNQDKRLISYHLSDEAMSENGNMDILNIIYNELANNKELVFRNIEGEKECANTGHQYIVKSQKFNGEYSDKEVCKDGELYEYLCQKCGSTTRGVIEPTLHKAIEVESATTFGYTTESGICEICGDKIHREYVSKTQGKENKTPWLEFPTR